jgi:REP element-mobilizing transposase RayT
MRAEKFIIGEMYHIFNRGAGKGNLFNCREDFSKFLFKIKNSNIPITGRLAAAYPKRLSIDARLVEIISYALLPNHYHFLIRQILEDGIPRFMHRLNMSYTKHINRKYGKSGTLYEGEYEAVHVTDSRQYRFLCAYINGNPEIHKISKSKEWEWSSCRDILGLRNGSLCRKQEVLDEFGGAESFEEYLCSVIDDTIIRKEEMKNLMIESW